MVVLLLVSSVMGDYRKAYYCAYLEGGVGGGPGVDSRLAGRVSVDDGNRLLNEFYEWFNHVYDAKYKPERNIIGVSKVDAVQRKSECGQAIQDTHSAVCNFMRECGEIEPDLGAGPVEPGPTAGPVGRAVMDEHVAKRWEA